jgi:hypothetical protein
MKTSRLWAFAALCALAMASTIAVAQPEPTPAHQRMSITAPASTSPAVLYVTDATPTGQLAAFYLGDQSCDAKPAPMAPGKGKGKDGGKKKCITANTPLDDGYMQAKFKKGSKGGKKPPST